MKSENKECINKNNFAINHFQLYSEEEGKEH